MRAHIVYAHPEPTSFNAALSQTARETLTRSGYTVTLSDLYTDGFDPVEAGRHYLDRADGSQFSALAEQRHASRQGTLAPIVQREIARLTDADLVIFQFPIWWHGPPAILKGWFDRVFVSGGLYTSSMRYDRGYFRGRRSMVSVTTGAPEEAFGHGARGGDLGQILWPVHYSLHYMGFSVLPPFAAYGVQGHGFSYRDDGAAETLRGEQLRQWSAHLSDWQDLSPIRFPGWSDWDEGGGSLASAG